MAPPDGTTALITSARRRAAWPLVQVARGAVSDGRGARIHCGTRVPGACQWKPRAAAASCFRRHAGGWPARGGVEGKNSHLLFGASGPGCLPAALSPRSARDPQLWWMGIKYWREHRGLWTEDVAGARKPDRITWKAHRMLCWKRPERARECKFRVSQSDPLPRARAKDEFRKSGGKSVFTLWSLRYSERNQNYF